MPRAARHIRAATVAAGLVAGAGLMPAAALAEGELKFQDRMAALGLAEPGYGWHAYHDAVVCADWDRDGDVDVLVVVSPHEKGPLGRQGRMLVNLLTETGKLAFADRTEKLIPAGTQKKVMADGAPFFFDVDADGDLDLCSISDESRPVTFLNDSGTFKLAAWGFSAQHCTIRDVNGDGLLDVIGDDTGALYVNAGKGKYRRGKYADQMSGHMPRSKVLPAPDGVEVDEPARKQAAGSGHVYYFWRRCDIDGDGQSDWHLALSQAYGFKLLRFYARRGAAYADVTAETHLPTAAQVKLADLNGDGRLDAVAMGKGVGGVFLGDGKGRFRPAGRSDANKLFRITTGGCYTHPQAIVDFDNDGVLDVLTCQPRVGSGSAVLRGLGQGRFERVLHTRASSGQALADLDNDGRLDVVASGGRRSQGLHVWLNASPAGNHWLKLRLTGPPTNPQAVNAVVAAYKPGRGGQAAALIAQAQAGPDALPVHLGLGKAAVVDLRVTFAPGAVKELKAVKADRHLDVSSTGK